jgi:Zn-dependent protease
MLPTKQGAIQLFRLAGVSVYLHWSWFIVAVIEIQERSRYASLVWNAAEYLTLFAVVLLHEFGHSLACRQVGGTADQIVLWPLGGVAYVNPPQRPGATLWSIAAGPLVNVVLLCILAPVTLAVHLLGWARALPNLTPWLDYVTSINLVVLLFNLMPVYPLDGGQILRSLLWFVLGRARSLTVATVLGFPGGLALVGLVYWLGWLSGPWTLVVALFLVLNCWRGFQHARVLLRLAKLPRHHGFACPACETAPPVGAFWVCGQCSMPFDTFATGAVCPRCGVQFAVTRCVDCGRSHPMDAWTNPALIARPL